MRVFKKFTSFSSPSRLSFTGAASALAFVAAGALPASAADLSYKDERPAIVSHAGYGGWAGFYIGAHAGGIINGDDEDDGTFSSGSSAGAGGGAGGATGEGSVGGDGGDGGDAFSSIVDIDDGNDVLAGLHIGYNWQRGNIVYGIEADIDANNSLDNLLGTLRGRLGIASDRALFYVTAGLAYVEVDGGDSAVFIRGGGGGGGNGGNSSVGNNGGAGDPGSEGIFGEVKRSSGEETGFVVGGGVEYKITDTIGLGIEGLYYSFDDNDLGIGDDGDIFSIRARLTMHLQRGHEGGSVKDGYPALASWGGFYLGGHLGGAFGSGDNIDEADFNEGGDGGDGGPGVGDAGGGGGGGGGGGTAAASLNDDANLIGGVHVGYNWQSGNLVYGLEGDASFSDDDNYSYLASARLRLGYATGSYLLYGTAGVAFAGIDRTTGIFAGNGETGTDGFDDADGGAGGPGGAGGAAGAFGGKEEDEVGFVVGAGVEAKLSDRMTLGFEGLYYGFDSDDGNGSGVDVDNNAVFDIGSDNDLFVLRSRLSYSLSGSREPLK